jgi:CheY-like chemotaxis protein
MAITVLLVDDEPTILMFVRRVLEREGYDVLCTSNAKAALDYCENSGQHISIVVTDIQMPSMTGRELAQSVAGLRPEIPILFMTGYILDSECRDPLTGDVRLDGHLIIRKPFRGEVILAVVEGLLRASALSAAAAQR